MTASPASSLPRRKPVARKQHSVKLLRMPPKELDEVARRCQCVTALLIRAQIEEQLALSPDKAKAWTKPLERLELWLVNERLDPLLTAEETALMRAKWGEWTRSDITTAAWRIESLAVLLFACGRLKAMPPPYEPASSDAVFAAMPFLGATGDVLAGARLLPLDEIDRLRRAYGVWRWRAKTELLHRGGVSPSTGEPFEVMVRRAAEKADAAGVIVMTAGDFDVGGRPYSRLSQEELKRAAAVALERGRAAEWLAGRGVWDAAAEL